MRIATCAAARVRDARPLPGWHPEPGLLPDARTAQTAGVTDTSTRPATAPTTWPYASSLRTAAELLLGLSFLATVAFGGFAALAGERSVVAQVAAVVFLVTLTCVLVSWFRGVEADDR